MPTQDGFLYQETPIIAAMRLIKIFLAVIVAERNVLRSIRRLFIDSGNIFILVYT